MKNARRLKRKVRRLSNHKVRRILHLRQLNRRILARQRVGFMMTRDLGL